MPATRRSAIVTGAASGMGRSMAIALAEAGYDVAAVDRNAQGLATLPPPIKPIQADLSDPASFERIATETLAAFGRIDVLVNNAGIGQAAIRACLNRPANRRGSQFSTNASCRNNATLPRFTVVFLENAP